MLAYTKCTSKHAGARWPHTHVALSSTRGGFFSACCVCELCAPSHLEIDTAQPLLQLQLGGSSTTTNSCFPFGPRGQSHTHSRPLEFSLLLLLPVLTHAHASATLPTCLPECPRGRRLFIDLRVSAAHRTLFGLRMHATEMSVRLARLAEMSVLCILHKKARVHDETSTLPHLGYVSRQCDHSLSLPSAAPLPCMHGIHAPVHHHQP